jgi:tetratricopeptide (TPR) repeat protein
MAKRLIWLLLAATAASAASAQTDNSDPDRNIIVTGIRPADAERELEACLARRCPPMEDMAATLRYAEALFIAGDYQRARAVLRRSIDRNRDEARRYPVAVAGLFRANARMAMHEGDGEDVRRSTYNVERSLRAGLQEADPRILGARLETAEMLAALVDGGGIPGNMTHGRFAAAERAFREVARDAEAIGRPDLAVLADLRRAMMYRRAGRPEARRELERIAALTDPQTRVQQIAARVVLAGMDRDAGDAGAIDRLAADLARAGLRTPTLLYAPPVHMAATETGSGIGTFAGSGANLNGDRVEIRDMWDAGSPETFDYWADVGFWINSQGRVEDLEVLRHRGPEQWLQPVLRSITGRIYSPPGSADLAYRVERYRYTSLLERRTDTRLIQHSARGRIEMIDITNSASPAGAAPQSPPAG